MRVLVHADPLFCDISIERIVLVHQASSHASGLIDATQAAAAIMLAAAGCPRARPIGPGQQQLSLQGAGVS